MRAQFLAGWFGRSQTDVSLKARSRLCRRSVWVLSVVLGIWLFPVLAQADCKVETEGTTAATVFTLHLSKTCTEAEREGACRFRERSDAGACSQEGRRSIPGVVIQGTCFDELPAQKVAAVKNLSLEDRRLLEGLNDEEVHVIRGPFVIQHSRVKGNSSTGSSRVSADHRTVVLIHSGFSGAVDLSRTIFLGGGGWITRQIRTGKLFCQDRFTQTPCFQIPDLAPCPIPSLDVYRARLFFAALTFPV